MENNNRHSILCPNCRKLISIDEHACPYCGLRSPGSRWRNNSLIRGLLDDRQLLRNMIYLNVAMFVLSILINPTSTSFSINPLDFLSPDNRSLLLLGATGSIPINQLHRWWTLLSASYLHGSILHLLFNMLALFQIAPLILQEYGRYRTLAIYTLSGVGGYVLSYLVGIPFTLGASAAVCGLIGAALYYGKSRGGSYGQLVYRQVSGWALGIFIFGFVFPGINNWAHGGGLLSGILTGSILGYEERSTENHFHKSLAMICILATLGTLIWAILSAFLILFSSRLS